MLEILALVALCTVMGKRMREKRRKPLLMQIAVVVCWFAAMFLAASAYAVYLAITRGPDAAGHPGLVVYPIMLLAAGLGQLVLFGIVYLIPANPPLEVNDTTPRSSV